MSITINLEVVYIVLSIVYVGFSIWYLLFGERERFDLEEIEELFERFDRRQMKRSWTTKDELKTELLEEFGAWTEKKEKVFEERLTHIEEVLYEVMERSEAIEAHLFENSEYSKPKNVEEPKDNLSSQELEEMYSRIIRTHPKKSKQ